MGSINDMGLMTYNNDNQMDNVYYEEHMGDGDYVEGMGTYSDHMGGGDYVEGIGTYFTDLHMEEVDYSDNMEEVDYSDNMEEGDYGQYADGMDSDSSHRC